MAYVIFKHKWFAPNGSRFSTTGKPVEVRDDLIPFLPSTARVVDGPAPVEPVKAEPNTLSAMEHERAQGDAFATVMEKAEAQAHANAVARKAKRKQ